VGVRINNAVLAKLDAIAEFEGLTRSAVINRLCERETEGSCKASRSRGCLPQLRHRRRRRFELR